VELIGTSGPGDEEGLQNVKLPVNKETSQIVNDATTNGNVTDLF